MPTESWIAPDEAPEMAARATAMIDAALVGSGLARDAYWAAVRKGYNTPYNDPAPRARGPAAPPNAVAALPAVPGASGLADPTPLPVAAIAALAAEARAV